MATRTFQREILLPLWVFQFCENLLKKTSTVLWCLDKETKARLPKEVLEESEEKGVQFLCFKTNSKEEKLKEVCDHLYQDGNSRILLEGGASLWNSALNSGLCQKLYLFQAPKLFYRDDIMHWTKGAKIQYLDLKNGIVTLLDKDILIEGLTDASNKL